MGLVFSKNLFAFSLVIASFITLPTYSSTPYTLKDLEALEASQHYREFLDHALDIRPSERGTSWRNMVSEMSSGFVDFNLARRRLSRETWLYIDQISLWPNLLSDEFFQAKRANYFRAYLPSCLEEQKLPVELCRSDILQYWRNSPKDPDIGIWIAEINEKFQLSLDPWIFLEKTGLSDLSEFYCQRPIVQKNLMSRLIAPMLARELDDKELLSHIDLALNQKCWQQIQQGLLSQMNDQRELTTQREHAFRLLLVKGALNQEQTDFFLSEYLLSGPVVGKTFNMAWGRVRELGQNFARRQKVFEQLKATDPLPDRLFTSANELSKRTVVEHFNLFFPEYFKFYAQTCLNYFQGKGLYPMGNPTVNCPEFFKTAEQTQIIDQEISRQFSGIKKAH